MWRYSCYWICGICRQKTWRFGIRCSTKIYWHFQTTESHTRMKTTTPNAKAKRLATQAERILCKNRRAFVYKPSSPPEAISCVSFEIACTIDQVNSASYPSGVTGWRVYMLHSLSPEKSADFVLIRPLPWKSEATIVYIAYATLTYIAYRLYEFVPEYNYIASNAVS